MFSVACMDLNKPLVLPPENYNLWGTLTDLREWNSKLISFDFEWDWGGKIKLCGMSDRMGSCTVWGWENDGGTPIPVGEWRRVFEEAEDLVGHNIISADTKYFESFGWNVRARLWDTLLISHLVTPDYRRGLGSVASIHTNKVFWKGDRGDEEEDGDETIQQLRAQWQTWDKEYAIPREYGGYGGCASAEEAYRLYNARDTDGSLQAWFPLRNLLRQYGMEDVYWNVSVPCAFICRDLSDAGLRIDTRKLEEIRVTLDEEIAREEVKLPEGLRPVEESIMKQVEAPPGMWKEKVKVCKGKGKLKHDPIEFLFTKPDWVFVCEACQETIKPGKMTQPKRVKVPAVRIKRPWNSTKEVLAYVKSKGLPVKLHMKTKRPTTDKNARKGWVKECPEFVVVDEIKKKLTLRNSFAKDELLRKQRMYFNLLTWGTAEGRLSSTGRDGGLNIQNQPKVIRKIYVPDYPDWGFLSSDFVQGENMLTAWLAKDWDRWERLHTEGYDEHSDMASKFFNLPYKTCLKGGINEVFRKPGKVINHGKNYGLGPKKALEYIIAEGITQFTLSDIRELFAIWEKVNQRTAQWQVETVALARAQGYLVNPFGRKRWFQGRDFAGKALAFLPASTLADITIRCMIAHYPNHNNRNISGAVERLGLGVVAEYMPGWKMCIQVHDSIVAQGPDVRWKEQAVRTKEIMTQPWKELGGFKLDVDLEYSTKSWGDVRKVEV